MNLIKIWIIATLFAITFHPSARAQTNHGSNPSGRLLLATDGSFYGEMDQGGKYGYGTVFSVNSSGLITVIYSFQGGTDGNHPFGGLIQGIDGNLYGATLYGGSSNLGTIFKLSTGGSLTTLVSFNNTNGSLPVGLIQARDGNFYGSTLTGGGTGGGNTQTNLPDINIIVGSPLPAGYGTVFQLTSSGTLTTLFSFSSTNGAYPVASVIEASDGNLYGMTSGNPSVANNHGTAFKITKGGAFTNLVTFSGSNGSAPESGLIQATDGNLYGTTSCTDVSNSAGTIFQLTTGGTLTTLHTFNPGSSTLPCTGLLQASDGKLYGALSGAGAPTAYQISLTGAFTSLGFLGNIDTQSEWDWSFVQASDGALYGTSVGQYLVDGSGGSIFKITTTGAFTDLIDFRRPPTIQTSPQSQTVTIGEQASFTVAPSVDEADPSNIFQWYKNGVAISGATDSTFTIPTTSTSDAGTYKVIVSNSHNSTSSASAVLTISLVPAIAVQPQIEFATAGQSAIFSVQAFGGAPLNYQWHFNGSDITGAKSQSYTITSASTNDIGNYTVTVSNSSGNVMSNSVPFYLVTSEESVQAGHSFSFTASPNGTGSFAYQWYVNTGTGLTAISSATSATYSSTAGSTGVYSVVISSPGHSQTESFGLLVAAMAVDTPTMPEWMLIVLAGLFVVVAVRQKAHSAESVRN